MTAVASFCFVVAAAAFALGLKLLARPTTARRGNLVSALGMAAAVLGALLLAFRGAGDETMALLGWIVGGLVLGAAVGAPVARLVKMTAMPEMVALFNGLGGMASLLVSWSSVHAAWRLAASLADAAGAAADAAFPADPDAAAAAMLPGPVAAVALGFAALVGGITFGGSIVAWGKLAGKMPSGPRALPRQHLVNAGLLLACLVLVGVYAIAPGQYWIFLFVVVLGLVLLGPMAVLPIGGADMPVVISLLNSYSGVAACAAGFAIGQPLLIVTGALVGASGLILTRIMCLAMNRSLANVLFSGFGADDATVAAGAATRGERREATVRTPHEAFHTLEAASSVVIVPGYGMAVAQAQHAVHDLAKLMQRNGTEVLFAIHPVAGRMPGHMSVLLAEADVPYEQLVDMDAINERMDGIDAAIVIGANDTVNPAARDDPSSPLAGMPVIEVDRARTVFVLKRSLGSGYAGVENPLFFLPNAAMILGDAKATVDALVTEFKDEG